jgi:GxxExxY protein
LRLQTALISSTSYAIAKLALNNRQTWNKRDIYYEGLKVGTRRADFIVENKVVVELKAVIDLEDVHLAQAKNYVVAYQFAKGLLINFGAKSLQYKLIFNSHLHSANS